MVNMIDPQWPTNGYSPLTAKDISEQVGPKGRVGEFIISEYMKYIETVQPIDSIGYPLIPDKKSLEGWRRYQVNRVINALETIGEMYKTKNPR